MEGRGKRTQLNFLSLADGETFHRSTEFNGANAANNTQWHQCLHQKFFCSIPLRMAFECEAMKDRQDCLCV
jgi:hypothetical protein